MANSLLDVQEKDFYQDIVKAENFNYMHLKEVNLQNVLFRKIYSL